MLVIVACGALPAAAQEQLDPTQKLIQRIVKSAKGDADAAAGLLAAAKMLSDDPKVQVAVCEAVYEYGIKAAGGLGSAAEALNILDKVDAKRAGLWAQKRTAVYRLLYSRATGTDNYRYGRLLVRMLLKTAEEKSKGHDRKEASALYREALAVAKQLNLPGQEEITAKLIAGIHVVQIQNVIDGLRAKLGANPGDTASRNSLVQIYLLGLDSPAEAAKRLRDNCDESLRKYVPLAMKPLAELNETQCLELGRWYDQLIEKGTTPTSKATAAGRAADYYHRFLSLHKARDAMGVAGTLALRSLEERMNKLGVKRPTPTTRAGQTQWIDLLQLIDPARQVVSGKWVRQAGELVASCPSRGLIVAPITALGSYDLEVALTVKQGTEGSVILPVGTGDVGLILGGWKGLYSGLAEIDGRQPGSDNVTTIKSEDKQGPLRIGARALLDIRVRVKGKNAQITAMLDGKKIIAWSGKQSSLGISSLWPMPTKTFGLGTYASNVVWHSVKLKRLDPYERSLKWISKGASYKPSSIYEQTSKQYPPLGTLLSGEGKLYADDFAFSTNLEANPHVVINLKKSQPISRIVIDNRRGPYWRQTKGLAVSVSATGRTWTPVWRAAKLQRSWLIDLKTTVRAKHVKIGLTTGEKGAYLALAGVWIYGSGY